jgi:tetratricopeptide (TPR) repeat protein
MVYDPLFKKAIFLSRMGKYDDSIKMMEAEVIRYRDSHTYYYVLGLICLYAGDFGGAFTYFSRAKSIKLQDPLILLGLAAVFLRRGETDRALDLYLDVQDLDNGNSLAKNGLNIIRRYGGTDQFSAWLGKGKLASLYPPMPWTGIDLKPLIIPGIIAALVLGIALGIRQLPVNLRGGMQESVLEKAERDNPVEMAGGSVRYVLTADQVLSGYTQARELFNKFRDESAKREINRILESNASTPVKNKARLLKNYTREPGFDTLKDRFTYAEVSADPLLYRDCYVLWRGSAANVKMGFDKVSFDFLVGYDTRQVMEGAVSVELSFAADINTNEPLEVLGRVVPLSTGSFIIAGSGVHQSPSVKNPH